MSRGSLVPDTTEPLIPGLLSLPPLSPEIEVGRRIDVSTASWAENVYRRPPLLRLCDHQLYFLRDLLSLLRFQKQLLPDMRAGVKLETDFFLPFPAREWLHVPQ